MRKLFLSCTIIGWGMLSQAAVTSRVVSGDFSKPPQGDEIWKNAPVETVSLMAQPMVAPRPKITETSNVQVQSLSDGKWIVFRLSWKDTEKSEAGKLGEFSDALALEFPVKEGNPPPVFMGAKGEPVHLYHWRAQYQYDAEHGKKDIKDIYPNLNMDAYPMEFNDAGNLRNLTDEKREQYSHGKAAGNPQSYKKNGIDEIFAEGFGTSSVIENVESYAKGDWKNGEWTLLIGRPLARKDGSQLKAGKPNYVGFAVWQGGKDEVGSRKAVTMTWTNLEFKGEEKK
jgi:hypothetical protein